MKLYEYQAKELLKKHGVPVSEGRIASTPGEAETAASELGGAVVVKAHVLAGGRGKAGGIQLARSPDEAREKASLILGMNIGGMTVGEVYVVRAVDIEREYYASVTVDRAARRAVLLVSSEGGVEIEDIAARSPEKIGRAEINPLLGPQPFLLRRACFDGAIPPDETGEMTKILGSLCACFFGTDASLVEVNPLCKTKEGKLCAVDAKIVIDENALFRRPELKDLSDKTTDDEIEREARRRGIAYVRLNGEIGIIGNGAGLVMATLDMVSAEGAKPANFLDIGGGARADLVRNAVEIILSDPRVKGILINVFGGITRCDEVARGIIDAASSFQIPVPVVIRLKGTRENEGREILKKAGFELASTVQEAARKIVSLSK
ncbi:MAG: ADP-forming succinate--CoA ligase subunit beta [bacterium]